MRAFIRSPALAAAGFMALAAAQSATTGSSPTAVQSVGQYAYTACAVEPFENGLSNTRSLHGASFANTSSMTVESCASFCAAFTYFGVEYGQECYCGNVLHDGTTLDTSGGCNFACVGDSGEQCGGSGRMNLYQNSGSSASPNLPNTFTPNNTASTTLTGYNYVNCVVEPFYEANANTTARALTGDGTTSSQMSVEYCASYCAGYAYFGVEYSDECYCGNSVDVRAQLESCGKCNSLCVGNVGETCGGPGHLSLYKVSNASQPVLAAASACSAAPASTTTATGTATASSGSGTGTGTSTASASGSTMTGITCPTANGTTYTSNGQSYVVECGIDRQGGDVYGIPEDSFGACLNYCATYPGCADVSYVNGNCYLKNSINAATSNSAVWGARLIAGASSPATVTASSGQTYNYLGVVNEAQQNYQVRSLTLASTTASNMTLEACATFCSGYQATFFGVEYGTQCYCGNNFTSGTTEAIGTPTNPLVTCGGNVTEQCGGGWELTTYALPGTPNPFDSNGNLISAASASSSSSASATASIVTASISSACNTQSSTVCGASATCLSLSPSSSTCQLTATTTAKATITASMLSQCNTLAATPTVCASTASCFSLGASSSTCGPTATAANPRSTTTASIASACNVAQSTVCAAGVASCSSIASGSSTCAQITSTQAAAGGACAASATNTAITVCAASAGTCQSASSGSTCGPTTTAAATKATVTASIASQCNTASNTVCQPGVASCSSLGASSSTCAQITSTQSAIGGACAASATATAATVCQAGVASCSSLGVSSSTCAQVTTTQNSFGTAAQCNPSATATAATVCGSGASCKASGSISYCSQATSTQNAFGTAAQCNPSATAAAATVCGNGGSCTASGSVSYCAQATSTQNAFGTTAQCNPSATAAAATVCGNGGSCTASGSVSYCAQQTSTQNAFGTTAQCNPSATAAAATVCGNGGSCQASGSTSYCAQQTSTQTAFGTAAQCNPSATAAAATVCATGASCVASGQTSYCSQVASKTTAPASTTTLPVAGSTCTPNFDTSSCTSIFPAGAQSAYNMYYGPANNGTYQTTPTADQAIFANTTACGAAMQCAQYALQTTPDDVSFGIVFYKSKCSFYCGRFNQKNGPAFNNTYTSYFSYSYGYSQ